MSKECLSIPFIFNEEEYQVIYSPMDIIDEIWIEKKILVSSLKFFLGVK